METKARKHYGVGRDSNYLLEPNVYMFWGVVPFYECFFFLGAVVIEIVGGSRAVRSFDEKEIIESLCYSVIVSLLLSGIEYVL